nr:immunoglobulin light chain junction region [Macaca mulatta]
CAAWDDSLSGYIL